VRQGFPSQNTKHFHSKSQNSHTARFFSLIHRQRQTEREEREMAVRVRSLIFLVIVITFVFITVSTLWPQSSGDSAIARGLRSSREYFNSASPGIPTTEKVISNEVIEAPLSVPTSPTVPPTQHDPLSDEPAKTTEEYGNGHAIAELPSHRETAPHPSKPAESKSTGDKKDDIRLLIGVMSPFWASARRHIIRNAYNQFPKDLPVDIVFVEGNLTSGNERNEDKVLAMQRTAVNWENSTYHDIMHVNCVENLEYGKTFEYLKKVGDEFGQVYTHVMKTDDDSFVNLPGMSPLNFLTVALVEVLRANKDEKHFYWGTTWTQVDRQHQEMWGSGYILGIDLIKWIATSDIPPHNTWGYEDLQVCNWLIEGGLDDNFVVNRTAFAGYPWPELADSKYKQENEIRPFDRWTLVTHPLKEDFMWVDTAEYYLSLKW
jgi:hypothetical protein